MEYSRIENGTLVIEPPAGMGVKFVLSGACKFEVSGLPIEARVTGNITGNVMGNVSGDVTGNVTGDVTGDVTGNVVGGVKETCAALAASGAITIPTASKTFAITKGDAPAAITLSDPTQGTHDGVRLTIISVTPQAHTLVNAGGSGFNQGGEGKDTATFGGAIGDSIVLEAYDGVWYVLSANNVVLDYEVFAVAGENNMVVDLNRSPICEVNYVNFVR